MCCEAIPIVAGTGVYRAARWQIFHSFSKNIFKLIPSPPLTLFGANEIRVRACIFRVTVSGRARARIRAKCFFNSWIPDQLQNVIVCCWHTSHLLIKFHQTRRADRQTNEGESVTSLAKLMITKSDIHVAYCCSYLQKQTLIQHPVQRRITVKYED